MQNVGRIHMRTFIWRPIASVLALIIAGGLLSAAFALHPAAAGSTGAGPNTVCSTTVPCKTYKNTNTGAGLQGINSNAGNSGAGLVGSATGNGDGVNGIANTGTGVFGYGATAGVVGSGVNTGVSGTASANPAVGV